MADGNVNDDNNAASGTVGAYPDYTADEGKNILSLDFKIALLLIEMAFA